MLNNKTTVECATHGTTTATYVCQHLLSGDKKGFHCGYDDSEPDEKWPDAWCDDCQKALKEEGQWNEKSAANADIQVICSSCYEDTRFKHWQQDNEIITKHHAICKRYLEKKQQKFIKKFNIDKHAQWRCHEDKGLLIFSHDGQAQVEAQISFSGRLEKDSQRWLWAWADQETSETVKKSSRKVRQLGHINNDLRLSSASWIADAQTAKTMTAVMAKTLKAIGCFQIPNKNGTQYMIIHDAKWLNNKYKKTWLSLFKKSPTL